VLSGQLGAGGLTIAHSDGIGYTLNGTLNVLPGIHWRYECPKV